jgi:histidyl-tRNA synthetase
MATQGVEPRLPGPDFFVIDFTADKTRALALSRRLRDAGAAVARDIISRPLAESLAYARGQHAGWALIIGTDGTDPEQVRILDLRAGAEPAAERMVTCGELLADPRPHFPGLGDGDA